MARPLSNILLKGIAGLPAVRVRSTSTVFGSFNCNGMRYSTTVPNDPETHEDFQPNNKLESSGMSLKDIVEQDVKDNPVMIYMKGVPDFPQCGFSSLAVRVLKHYNIPLSARNILEDPELKSAVKSFRSLKVIDALKGWRRTLKVICSEGVADSLGGNWPTFPQIFIKGEFIGGSDIILNMHQSGELKEKLQDVATSQ